MDAETAETVFRELVAAFPGDRHKLSYTPTETGGFYHLKVEFESGLPITKIGVLTHLTIDRHEFEMAEFDTDSIGLTLHLR